jgi:hypothetical protein
MAKAGAEPAVCGVGAQGFKCAIVSWVAPLLAAGVLIAGLRYPLVSGFNILVVAFGVTATLRSLAHIRKFGACGLGGHVAVGVVLNLAVVTLVVVYLFTALDPFGLRP